MKPEIVVSQDGSHTLYLSNLNEHYHSTFGAISESMHIFIRHGLQALNQNPVRLLEAGFGTGLNAWLTLIEGESAGRTIDYTGIEKFPLEMDTIRQLNYPALLKKDDSVFLRLHEVEWERSHKLTPGFTLTKTRTDLQLFSTEQSFNLIYFDAFAPEIQPELWSAELFERLGRMMIPGGILVTYSAKGMVRRNLLHAGFQVAKHPGPAGKREITVATYPTD